MISLADAIIDEQYDTVKQMVRYGVDLNQIDEYGFTPLIEAAIIDNIDLINLFIQHGANVNLQDTTGGTALQWAAENNNLPLTELLLKNRANPNAYNFSGQPVLVMPVLRRQEEIKKLMMAYGADLIFAQDYINTKLLGHMFELVGMAHILTPDNQFIEVDFEGFVLEVTINMILESLVQFENHYAARRVRQYGHITRIIINTFQRAARLIQYQQYRTNIKKHRATIQTLVEQEPVIFPIGYEGHAITFIKLNNIFVKCDRREDSRLYDNIVYYTINHPQVFSYELIIQLLYERKTDEFVNQDLPNILGLTPITELKIPAQISGNCSWANVEACIPAIFFLLMFQADDFQQNITRYKNTALHFFNQWREWNKERTLQFCIQSFQQAGPVRRACKAEILAAILFQNLMLDTAHNASRIERVLTALSDPQCARIVQNYIKSYCYEDGGEEGKRFLQLLKNYGYLA